MKDKKIVKTFEEHQEKLNISDVSVCYVSIIEDGCYDNHYTETIYAGFDKDKALGVFKKYNKRTYDCSYSAFIEVWINGENKQTIEIED